MAGAGYVSKLTPSRCRKGERSNVFCCRQQVARWPTPAPRKEFPTQCAHGDRYLFLSLFRDPVLCGHNLINLLLRVSRALRPARRILPWPLGVMQFLRSRFLFPRSREHYFPVTFRFRLSEKCRIEPPSENVTDNICALAFAVCPRRRRKKNNHINALPCRWRNYERVRRHTHALIL